MNVPLGLVHQTDANFAATRPAYPLAVERRKLLRRESYIVQDVSGFNVHEARSCALRGRNGARKEHSRSGPSPAWTTTEVAPWRDMARSQFPAQDGSPRGGAKSGLGLVPEDRRIIQGLPSRKTFPARPDSSSPSAWSDRAAPTSCSRASASAGSRRGDTLFGRRAADVLDRPGPWRVDVEGPAPSMSPTRASRPVIVDEIGAHAELNQVLQGMTDDFISWSERRPGMHWPTARHSRHRPRRL